MKFHFPLYTIFGLTLSCTVLAQSASDTDAPPLYDVEVIIFKNIRAPQGREYILPLASPSRDEDRVDLSSPNSIENAKKQGYELLPASSLRLTDIAGRLAESSRYELILHIAWRQPGMERGKALPVWIQGGKIFGNEYMSIDNRLEQLESIPYVADPGSETSFQFDQQTPEAVEQKLRQNAGPAHKGLYELEGKITVELSRYLHTHTDLVLRRPRLVTDELAENAAQAEYLASRAADTRILNNHVLKEHRRMRSKQLHYLDSPEFAMLILITPYQPAAQSGALSGTDMTSGG